MDGEQVRALLAAVMWQAGTADERKKKTAEQMLPAADSLLLASYSMGPPLGEERLLNLAPDAFSAQRLADWLSQQDPSVAAMFRAKLLPPI